MTLFGPAGTPQGFFDRGYKHSVQLPDFLEDLGLDLFEYQCGNGVTVGEATARKIGEAFRAKGKILSVHAPYFISLSSVEPEKRANSVSYILKTAQAAQWMGAERIVVHSGSCGKISRQEALVLAKQTLTDAVAALKNAGLEQIVVCPETMGKINQLGTLEEVLELCTVCDTFLPTVDFGHLNARTRGGITGKADYAALLDLIEIGIGLFTSPFPYNLFPVIALANYFLFFGKDVFNIFPLSWRIWFRRMTGGKAPIRQQPKVIQFKTTSQPKPDYNHKCTVCGRTDVTNPELDFRYCSKCHGYYCYCEDHISGHAHIQ